IETNRDTISAVQGLAAQLRPHLLDDLGIGAALDWLVGDIGKRGGTQISVSCELGDRGLGPDISITVFRIVQESLGNVLRHASAKEAVVRVRKTGDLLSLSITDDGVGISDTQRNNPSAFGIIGMKERVQLHGGSFSVLGSPTGGTVVSVTIPLPAREDSKP
ncbi:MAG: sensor histidine kinase, partial [Rectinemataceae bacterium]